MTSLHAALKRFAETVRDKLSQPTPGEPEDQLRGPFEALMGEVAGALGWKVVCTGESRLPDRTGRPDYAVHLNRLLVGFVELKAPGLGAVARRFKGRNREQWRRFQAIPNLLYCDGNEWALYRAGEPAGEVVRLSGNVASEGGEAVSPGDAHSLERLLRDFLSWHPIIPTDRRGKVDLKRFAVVLAPLCRWLREDVVESLADARSPLALLARDWRQLLFPDAVDAQFADAYAQTVTFALLLGRSEGAEPLTLENAESALRAQHSLLSRALQVLTDPGVRSEMASSLDLLLRVIAEVPPSSLHGPEDPWLYFYEDFLAAYDPKLRKDVGAYYTPVEVVRAQVRLLDDLLVSRLGLRLGFADPGVVTLDPSAGTGTYLLGVIEHALRRVESEQGAGAVPGQATKLAENLYGFEVMVGPYAVTELRTSRALRDRGAMLPTGGTHVYLTDTLESPYVEPPQLPLFLRPIAEQHAKALQVKNDVPVLVCLGNPPYDRHEAAGGGSQGRAGGWVRFGDDSNGGQAILQDFLAPALAAGHGVRAHNLYNLYVYFWRWALWKVFEHETSRGPGLVSFISAASYLDGDAFAGMREKMRRLCDEIWILDLGGEGRGTRQTENVFAIQTPVAIAVAARFGKTQLKQPAVVRYARLEGKRDAKLATLDAVTSFGAVGWTECPADWQAPFRPAGTGRYFRWPLLIDLMPWQQSGIKAGRTWVIGPDAETLKNRWRALLNAEGQQRRDLFKESPTGRKVHEAATSLFSSAARLHPISGLGRSSPEPEIARFAWRSFDRQFLFADARLLDRPSPALWRAHGERQLYLTTLLNHPLGQGPAVTAAALIPDLHHFRGSFGAKEVFPLYRDSAATEPNLLTGLLELLATAYRREISAEDFLSYVYGILAHPAFTAHFWKELETRELRLPITKDPILFAKVQAAGRRLVWLHTYGERFVPQEQRRGHVPRGAARCEEPISGEPSTCPRAFAYEGATRTLVVGDGRFRPIDPEVYAFEVSGLKVVQSWIEYRLKRGAGKTSSRLDEIRADRWTSELTTELLDLLWVLEATVAGYREQAELLDKVLDSACFEASELPTVSKSSRRQPAATPVNGELFER